MLSSLHRVFWFGCLAAVLNLTSCRHSVSFAFVLDVCLCAWKAKPYPPLLADLFVSRWFYLSPVLGHSNTVCITPTMLHISPVVVISFAFLHLEFSSSHFHFQKCDCVLRQPLCTTEKDGCASILQTIWDFWDITLIWDINFKLKVFKTRN